MKAWYEEDDPHIHSGLYFPGVGRSNQQSHHYETIPYNGQDVPNHYYEKQSPSPQPFPPLANTEHKRLAKQRLDYYFSKQGDPHNEMHRSFDRRESSPSEFGRMDRYRSVEVESPTERKLSDSEVLLAHQVSGFIVTSCLTCLFCLSLCVLGTCQREWT